MSCCFDGESLSSESFSGLETRNKAKSGELLDRETIRSGIHLLGVQKSSELFFVKFNLYSYVIVRK